ncbi:uncharacterized protein LOC125678619 [Ostrea edulis]|uniref:uncharacterized protein LOC125678619 n=1 Tax=Ostrea edulis TaxID=37623 RepID=UPI0024AF5B28|nr:uncharacterized protein LOC125678619 [Ostrea edulis]
MNTFVLDDKKQRHVILLQNIRFHSWLENLYTSVKSNAFRKPVESFKMTAPGWKMGENAEKSPSVHYANWKEDILLKKQLHVLERSEKNVIHRIKIDQKVLFKRFQDKLYRSKLCEARMHGNKDTEMELRARNLHGLNTDFGSAEKDYEFLTKLQNNRKQRNTKKKPPRIKVSPIVKQNKFDDDVFVETNDPRRRSNSITEGMTSRSMGALSSHPLLSVVERPSTTGSHPQQHAIEVSVKTLQGKKDIHMNISAKGNRSDSEKKQLSELSKSKKARPQTCMPSLLLQVTKEAHETGRKSEQENHRKKSSSFFEDEKKIDIVELHLSQIKSLNYDEKIQEFADTLNDLVVNDIEDRDYYTLRLQAAMKEISNMNYDPVPGTPEDEYNRHVGNLELKSLTFKNLNLDFSSRDHLTTADSFRPDIQPVVLSSDGSSDEDDGDDE